MESEITTSKGIKYKLNFVPDAMKNLKLKFKVAKPKISIIDSEVDSTIINPSLTIPNKSRQNSIQCNYSGKDEFVSRNIPILFHKQKKSAANDSQQDYNSINKNKEEYMNTIECEKNTEQKNSKINHFSGKVTSLKCVIPGKSIPTQPANKIRSSTISSNMSLDSFHHKDLLQSYNKRLLTISQENGSGKNSISNSKSKSKHLIKISSESAISQINHHHIQSYEDSNYRHTTTKQYKIPKPNFKLKASKDGSVEAPSISCNRLHTENINQKNDFQKAYISLSSEKGKLKNSSNIDNKNDLSIPKEFLKNSIHIKSFKEKLLSMAKISIDQSEMTKLKRLYSNGKIDSTTSKRHKPKDSKPYIEFATTNNHNTLESAVEEDNPENEQSHLLKSTDLKISHQKSNSLQDSLSNILKRTKRLMEASLRLNNVEN